MCAAIISAVAELPVERELMELASFALDYGIHIATSVKNETFRPR